MSPTSYQAAPPRIDKRLAPPQESGSSRPSHRPELASTRGARSIRSDRCPVKRRNTFHSIDGNPETANSTSTKRPRRAATRIHDRRRTTSAHVSGRAVATACALVNDDSTLFRPECFSQNMVPKAGLEPAQLTPLPPQDSVSTNSTTWAKLTASASHPAAPHLCSPYLQLPHLCLRPCPLSPESPLPRHDCHQRPGSASGFRCPPAPPQAS